eukprot:m.66724 g.66724  ORF g.66724 m.66724 type:complete len:156 (+) comp13604_c0_seq3:262-729(+)
MSRLSLAYRGLARVAAPSSAKDAEKIIELDLSHNQLERLSSLSPYKNIASLVLDHNSLTSHVQFPFLPKLKRIWINNNKIDNLVLFIDKLAAQFPDLVELSMMNNPAAPSYLNGGTKDQNTMYRLYVISRLPKLETLDHIKITAEERKAALQLIR